MEKWQTRNCSGYHKRKLPLLEFDHSNLILYIHLFLIMYFLFFENPIMRTFLDLLFPHFNLYRNPSEISTYQKHLFFQCQFKNCIFYKPTQPFLFLYMKKKNGQAAVSNNFSTKIHFIFFSSNIIMCQFSFFMLLIFLFVSNIF